MSFPLPGTPVRGSKTGKPLMALLDLIGRTWALGIIWNLHRSPANFRALQAKCEGISPTLLNTRLKELRIAQLIEKVEEGYQLTALGVSLFQVIEPMGKWSTHWQKALIAKEQLSDI
ncbi:MAG: winged helix-turn-helix transcriptional regulator [Thalassotalea sp.]